MAIDFGDARIGIAISDVTGTLTGRAFIIEERDFDRAARRVAEEASAGGVARLVLGFPRNMDGSLGPRAEKTQEFAALLERASGLPVILWDERRTTVDASRILSEVGKSGRKKKKLLDAVAASLILEGFLSSDR